MISAADSTDLSEAPSTVLVVGKTGMLRGAVDELLASGRTVILVARRASAVEDSRAGRLITVAADWERPEQFGDAVRRATRNVDVGAALLWIHQPYRDQVTRELKNVLSADAVVVRLWGSSGSYPAEQARAAVRLEGRRMCDVYLGSVTEARGWRWLTDKEISSGALRALVGTDAESAIGELVPR